jgi:hypothetical protein
MGALINFAGGIFGWLLLFFLLCTIFRIIYSLFLIFRFSIWRNNKDKLNSSSTSGNKPSYKLQKFDVFYRKLGFITLAFLSIIIIISLGKVVIERQTDIKEFISQIGIFGRSKEYVSSKAVEMVDEKLSEEKATYRCSSVVLVKKSKNEYEGIVNFNNGNKGTISVTCDGSSIYCKWMANPFFTTPTKADIKTNTEPLKNENSTINVPDSSNQTYQLSAFLVYKDGSSSDFNLIDNKNISLWNTIIGEGSAGNPSEKTKIVVTINGSFDGFSKLVVSGNSNTYFDKAFSLITGDNSKKEVIIDETGCIPLTIQIIRDNKVLVSKEIPFACGE